MYIFHEQHAVSICDTFKTIRLANEDEKDDCLIPIPSGLKSRLAKSRHVEELGGQIFLLLDHIA